MKVYSDDLPDEMEFLQGGLLVRWNIEQYKKEDSATNGYKYDEVKLELSDTEEQIISKLKLVDYSGDKIKFAERIMLKTRECRY
jgi:hypothetical protein